MAYVPGFKWMARVPEGRSLSTLVGIICRATLAALKARGEPAKWDRVAGWPAVLVLCMDQSDGNI